MVSCCLALLVLCLTPWPHKFGFTYGKEAPSLEEECQKQTNLALFLGQCVTELVVGLSTPHFLYLLNEDVLSVCHED